MKDEKFFYVALALAALAGFLLFKRKTPADDTLGAAYDGCQSIDSDSDSKVIAQTIKQAFDSQYLWVGDTASELIVSAMRNISDACGYKKVFSLFGQLNTFTMGSGNLDFWMTKLSTTYKDQARPFAYGENGGW